LARFVETKLSSKTGFNGVCKGQFKGLNATCKAAASYKLQAVSQRQRQRQKPKAQSNTNTLQKKVDHSYRNDPPF
jgi:hypothetical protein